MKSHTMDSLGTPEMATFKSPIFSTFDDGPSPLTAWLPDVHGEDGGNTLAGFFAFCDLNHCKYQLNYDVKF